MLLRESLGVGADGSTKAFPSKDVDAFLSPDRRAKLNRDISEFHSRDNSNHFIVAVDPAGGGTSAFAVASMVQVSTGSIIVRASLASCPAALATFQQELCIAY